MKKFFRLPPTVAIALTLVVLIAFLWPWSLRYSNQLIYRAADGTTYALGTHPHGFAYVTTTHGRDLEELWRVHQDPLPGGLRFDGFKWGEMRSVTYYGMSPLAGTGSQDPSAVFTRTDVRRWEPPEHDFLGLGWGGERRTIGPPIPPDPLTYERRVLSVPYWAILLVLVYGLLAWARRSYLKSRPVRSSAHTRRSAADDLPLLRK